MAGSLNSTSFYLAFRFYCCFIANFLLQRTIGLFSLFYLITGSASKTNKPAAMNLTSVELYIQVREPPAFHRCEHEAATQTSLKINFWPRSLWASVFSNKHSFSGPGWFQTYALYPRALVWTKWWMPSWSWILTFTPNTCLAHDSCRGQGLHTSHTQWVK